MSISRRELLAMAAACPLLGAYAPNIAFPTEPNDRLAMASYSLRTVMVSVRNPQGPVKLLDLPRVVGEQFGIRNLELLNQHFPSTEPAYLAEVLAAVKAAGSRVVNIPTGVGASVYDPDVQKRGTAIGNARKWIDVAVALECPSVRVHIQKSEASGPDVGRAALALREIAAYGSENKVVVNLENDDPTTEDASFIVKVVDAVNTPWLRALPDFCNSMLRGDETSNYKAVTEMFARAYNISHAKDSEVDGKKLYRIDLARTFAIAKAAGFKGWFSVEWEGEGEMWSETAKLVNECRKQLA